MSYVAYSKYKMNSIIGALIMTSLLLKSPALIGSQEELNSGKLTSEENSSQCSCNISCSKGAILITEINCSITENLIQIKNICNGIFHCYCAVELNHSTKYNQQETQEINNDFIIHQVNYSCKVIEPDGLTVFDMTNVVSSDLNDNKGHHYLVYDTNTSEHYGIQCRVESRNNLILKILYVDWRSDCQGKISIHKDNVDISHTSSECKRNDNGETNNVIGQIFINLYIEMTSGFVWIELNISAAAKLKCEEVSETLTTFIANDISSFGFISQGVIAVMAVVIFIAMFYFSVIRAPKSKPNKANLTDECRRDYEQSDAVEVNLTSTDRKENENKIKTDYEDTRI